MKPAIAASSIVIENGFLATRATCCTSTPRINLRPVNNSTLDHFVGLGYSFRFQAVSH
jgi:hypothetical protein